MVAGPNRPVSTLQRVYLGRDQCGHPGTVPYGSHWTWTMRLNDFAGVTVSCAYHRVRSSLSPRNIFTQLSTPLGFPNVRHININRGWKRGLEKAD